MKVFVRRLIATGVALGAATPGAPGLLQAQASPRAIEVWRSDARAELARVESLDVDSRGRVYIAEGRSRPAITILGADGRLERRLGRAGGGPGEFLEPLRVQVLPGDSLLVYDRQQYRLSFFAPGEPQPQRVLRLEGSVDGAPFDVRVLPDGRLLIQLLAYYVAGADPAGDVGRMQSFALADPLTGRPLGGSVLRLPEPRTTLIARQGPIIGAMPVGFGAPHAVRVAPDGTLVYGPGDALRFERYDLSGRRIGGFDTHHSPPAFTRHDLERELDGSREDMFASALRSAAPRAWPSYTDFRIDDRGRIFATMGGPRAARREVRAYEPTGRLIARFELPPGTRILRATGDALYAVVTDDFDVPSIVKYAIPGLHR